MSLQVSYHSGLRYFTVHSCPLGKGSSGLSCFMKPRRTQKDLKFLSTSPHEAFRWVNSFADQQCYVNLLPHPMASSKKHSSELIPFDAMLDPYVKCRSPPKILVILNPRSGHGRSSKVFHGKVEPIFKVCLAEYKHVSYLKIRFVLSVVSILGRLTIENLIQLITMLPKIVFSRASHTRRSILGQSSLNFKTSCYASISRSLVYQLCCSY